MSAQKKTPTGFSLEKLAECALWILSFAVLMAKPWESTLQAMDSAIHARLALEVTRNGLTLPMPNFNLDTGAPFFNDHPFTLFYLVGHFMRTFGANAWSARFIPSLFGVLSIALLYRIGKKFYSPTVGLLAGLILLLTPLWIQFSARFQLDPAMCFFILASFYFWMKAPSNRNALLSGLSAGAAVAFKSPVGFLIFPCVVVVEAVLQKNFSKSFFKRIMISGTAALVPPAIIWGITANIGGVHLLQDYFQRQVLGTAIQGRSYVQPYDIFAFLGVLWSYYRIWTIVFLIALWNLPYLKTHIKNRNSQLILAAIFITVAVISLMRFKFPHYFLPAFPFMALLLAILLEPFFKKRAEQPKMILQKGIVGLALLAPTALLVLPIPTAPESFPALRKFAPFIVTHGKPKDRILFVQNAQPYGSEGDYFVETVFYTGKKFFSTTCAQADPKVEEAAPEWILVSGKTIHECVSEKFTQQYPLKLQAGNQYLLGKTANSPQNFDLTPLYRELKAPVDDQIPPLPNNIFYRYE